MHVFGRYIQFKKQCLLLAVKLIIVLLITLLFSVYVLAKNNLTLSGPPVKLDMSQVDAIQISRPASSGARQRANTPQIKTVPKNAVYSKTRLFGTVEFKSKLKEMPKWTRITNLYKNRDSIDDDFNKSGRKAEYNTWIALKEKLKDSSPLEKARAVNSFFNKWPYKTDMQVYGVEDYWSTPAEFIKNSGDCEDYAIAKYYALKELGISQDVMRLIVLKDTIRNLDHAVLGLYIDEDIYILDILVSSVVKHEALKNYLPYYSFNEVFRWSHVPPSK